MSTAPHILHVFPSFVPGGSQVRTTALMAGFGASFRHSVMSMDGKLEARSMLPPDFPLGVVEAPPKAGLFGTLRALRAVFEVTSPELVCTYNWGAIESVMAARSFGDLAVIHHEDGFGSDEAGGLKRRRTWTRRFALGRVDAVVVPSHNLGRIASKKWKVYPAQLHVVPNGIDLERFHPAASEAAARALRDELGIPQAAFVVGTVGHLRPEKNIPRLVEALSLARAQAPTHDWRLLVVGDGAERPTIAARASELGLSELVHFAGHRADCAPAVRAMDIFCLSSDTEQMPISLVEAMACERPAVSTDVGDVARMVPASGSDLLVPLSDGAAGLATRLASLAADPERRVALGSEGRQRVLDEYGFDTMLATYRRLYLTAMGRLDELEALPE
jgi:glycosyltransferase involved in cell wall biosynthesis